MARQRQFLKGLAHGLSPVVRVGKGGITLSIIDEMKRSLQAHELIKVRIEVDASPARRALAVEIARAAEADIVGTIGKLTILYRPRQIESAIKLPQ